jgi:hypothetical protein
MILPTKRLPQDRALLAVGAEALLLLSRPLTVSKLWHDLKHKRAARSISTPIPFDWFVLALAFLHSIGAVELKEGRLHKVRS